MPMSNMTPHRKRFLQALGADIRAARERGDRSCDDVARSLDYNRDALSKIERGVNNLRVYEYLQLMNELREQLPDDHPAVLLRSRLMTK